MDARQAAALQMLCKSIIESCIVAGDLGAPGGILYTALSTQGCTIDQFTQLMAGMEAAGFVTKAHECYKATDLGRKFVARASGVVA